MAQTVSNMCVQAHTAVGALSSPVRTVVTVFPDPVDAKPASPRAPQPAEPSASAASDAGVSDRHTAALPFALRFALFGLAGVLEGLALVHTLLLYPVVLADQFVFKNWVVMKMFLSAMGCSMMTQALFAKLRPEQFAESRSYPREVYGFKRVMAGSCVVGVGMATAGSGPTMFAPTIGAGVHSAPAILGGAVLGALLVAVATRLGLRAKAAALSTAGATLDQALGWPYPTLAGGLGAALLGAALVLEAAVPYHADAAPYVEDGSPWPPVVAGLTIGVGQIFVRLVTSEGMGGATGVYTLVHVLSCGRLAPEASPRRPAARYQPVYNYGFVLLGCWAGAQSVAPVVLTEVAQAGFAAPRSFVGGFLTMVGALFAGGCTCGHGVSGTSELSLESFAGAGAIFGGAVATGLGFHFALGHPECEVFSRCAA